VKIDPLSKASHPSRSLFAKDRSPRKLTVLGKIMLRSAFFSMRSNDDPHTNATDVMGMHDPKHDSSSTLTDEGIGTPVRPLFENARDLICSRRDNVSTSTPLYSIPSGPIKPRRASPALSARSRSSLIAMSHSGRLFVPLIGFLASFVVQIVSMTRPTFEPVQSLTAFPKSCVNLSLCPTHRDFFVCARLFVNCEEDVIGERPLGKFSDVQTLDKRVPTSYRASRPENLNMPQIESANRSPVNSAIDHGRPLLPRAYISGTLMRFILSPSAL
jgi:hypothetical protein